jgi:hypothetical protein
VGRTWVRATLLVSGLALAIALTVAWDGIVSYELFRFFEFVF